jgi:hypothetical protein
VTLNSLEREAAQLLIKENSIWTPFCGCWLWTGTLAGHGYPQLRQAAKWCTRYAHRLSYLAFRGEIPDGMLVCHTCDTPCCVNPEHLWIGTSTDNVRDCIRKGRFIFGEKNGMFGQKGEKHPWFGKKHSLQEIAKMRGKKRSPESRVKIRIARLKYHQQRRAAA